MVERAGEARLAQEALPEMLVLGELGREQLERDAPLEGEVMSAVDDAHAAAPEQPVDPIPDELRADARIRLQGQSVRPSPAQP